MTFWVTCLLSTFAVWAIDDWSADLSQIGLSAPKQKCQVQNRRAGQPGQLQLTELSLNCGNLELSVELIKPFTDESYQRHLANQAVKLGETYAAGRNPYTGFISATTQCPTQNNYVEKTLSWNGQSHKLRLGRLTERRAWGGCGGSEPSHWGGHIALLHNSNLVDLTFKTKVKMSRDQFARSVDQFVKDLRRI